LSIGLPGEILPRTGEGAEEADVLKQLVEYLAKALVDNPDAVSVEAEEDEKTTTLRLKVAPSDLGRVIGKQGRTARAMRTLLHATAAKSRRRAVLEIVE
jgi:predicted RNA-binding protein YlqC (UPF0109 family)